MAREARSKAHPKPGTRRRKPASADIGDVALVFGRDEHGVHVLRRRHPDAPVEAGVLQPLVEGKPITEEVISLSPRSEAPMMFDVKTVLERRPSLPAGAQTPPQRESGDGPVQVATDSYRRGWDTVFGRKRAGGRDLN